MALTRDELLKKKAAKRIEEVQVPEWGGSVFVRELSAAERDAFETSMVQLDRKGKVQGHNLANVRARLAVFALCDEHGERMFGDGDAEALGELSASALQRVFEVAQRLSGISNEDVEELEKNSVSGPTGSSFSS